MVKIWLLVMRPWAFTASFVPIALGAALAWYGTGVFHPVLFLLTVAGGTALHAGTNFINTYGDHISGVDRAEAGKACPQIVDGTVTVTAVRRAGWLSFALAALLGLPLVYLRGWLIFWLGVLGIVAGYAYTAGFYPYKYKGWGSSAVFLLMGPLMAWPAYYIQTGQHSWLPVLASLPAGFLVSAIVHANDYRDLEEDDRAGIRTLALLLGREGSWTLLLFLLAGAFLSLLLLIALALLPAAAALPFLPLPALRRLTAAMSAAYRGSRRATEELAELTATQELQFGLLLIAGLLLDRWVH